MDNGWVEPTKMTYDREWSKVKSGCKIYEFLTWDKTWLYFHDINLMEKEKSFAVVVW